MANEIFNPGPAIGLTAYAVVANGTSQAWNQNTSAFENFNASNLTTTKYCITLTETPTASQRYIANFPSSIPAGVYRIDCYVQAGGSPATSDQWFGGNPAYQWSGSAEVPLSSLAPASTALSNVNWTNTRAGYLDNLSGGAVALESEAVLIYNAVVALGSPAQAGSAPSWYTTPPSAATIAADVGSLVVDSTYTLLQYVELIGAATAGADSGGPGSPAFKNLDGSKTVISGTADSSGNRSGITYSP